MSVKRGTRKQAQAVLGQPVIAQGPNLGQTYILLAVRESDASELIQFEEMARRSVALLVGKFPALQRLLDDPLGPIRDPNAWNCLTEKRRGAKSFVFLIDSVIVAYHLGSAVKSEPRGELNFYTDVILDLVATHKIRSIYAFNVNRLVRDQSNGNKMADLFIKMAAKVVTSSIEIDFVSPSGPLIWAISVMIAAEERRGIVERNRLGRIAVARRNEWPHGDRTVPLGYQREGRTIVPIDAERARVARVLTLMADPSLSSRQFVEALGSISVSRPRLADRHGEGTTVAVALHPKDILQSFMNLLPLYETGIYEMALPNPTPNATTFGNLPVHRSDTEVDDGEQEDDHGFIVLRYEFGTPEGGWAEPSVFEAIRAKQAANRSFVNGMRERRPFGGRPAYERDGLLLQFDSNAHGCYRLRRLSTTDGPGSTGTPAGRQRIGRIDSAETIALIDTADLHRAVVNGIVDAVSQELGSPGALSPNAFSVLRGPDEVLALTLDHHRHRAARAREQALRTSDSATSEAFRQDAEREDRRILELTAQATESAEIEPSTPGSAEVEAAPLLETLAKLALTGQKVPGAIFTACSQIIPGLQLFPMGRHDEVGWSAQVRLPTVSGDVLVFDEIQGSVPCRGVRSPPSRRRQRDAGVLEEYASGAPLEAIAQRHGVAVSRVWTLARASLIEAQIPESTLARLGSAPIPELRALVGTVAIRGLVREAKAHMNDLVALADLLVAQGAVPQGAAPQWAASTIAHYLGPLSARSKWSAPNVLGQAAVDAVESDGGVITVRRLCQQVGPLAQSNSVAIAHVLGFGTISQPAVLEPVTVVDKSAGGRYNPEAELQLVKCPHCAGVATLVLRITELPRHLLCRSCGRSPTASFVYPASYLALPSGLHHFPGVSWLSRYRAGTEGTNPRPPRPALTDADKRALVADYQDHSKPVLGPGGIVEKYQVSAGRMYQVIDEAGIQRRRPYRPRGT